MPLARRLLPRLLIRIRRFFRNDQLVLAGLALVIGTTAGAGAIAFRWLIGAVQFVFYGFSAETVVTLAADLPWWQILFAPAVGGLAIGLVLRFLVPGGRPLGVPHVMEVHALRDGRMSVRSGLAAAVASAASLGVGASVGREGPVVHLGATIGSGLARVMRLPSNLSRTLLGCGVAAAVAASFNAPIAGVFFALEVVVGQYALTIFAPIVLAGVSGTVLSRLYYGDFPAFILPARFEIQSFLEFPAFAVLGGVSALVSVIFMKSAVATEDLADRTPIPRVLRPAVGGLFVGAIALWFPHVLGVGYEATDMALKGMLPLWLLLALIVAKGAATAISLGFGFAGGMFSPALFLGAMTGGAFGVIATHVFPQLSSGTGAYTLIGMGAVSGAVLGAPISTILIIFEMTGDYALTTALMVSVVIASTLVDQAFGRNFFTWQLERSGIDLKRLPHPGTQGGRGTQRRQGP
ncbi:MAG TPA: chloride channel protein [Alphaproteobacteria bacterium]|nr:chloride channel protein [Alphaproteobacteria bacterium]